MLELSDRDAPKVTITPGTSSKKMVGRLGVTVKIIQVKWVQTLAMS
jgi:hypothetical protein